MKKIYKRLIIMSFAFLLTFPCCYFPSSPSHNQNNITIEIFSCTSVNEYDTE